MNVLLNELFLVYINQQDIKNTQSDLNMKATRAVVMTESSIIFLSLGSW